MGFHKNNFMPAIQIKLIVFFLLLIFLRPHVNQCSDNLRCRHWFSKCADTDLLL